jgi:2-polyprenyl-6-methoxyphenol hydroxylase-like FAD-dependent oxidoreductase
MSAQGNEPARYGGQMTEEWDAIVVGARCAGSPVAMLLAQKGYRVLVLDSAKFPSDTISTHLLHPPAVAALERWSLLDRLEMTGCPPIQKYTFDFGPFAISAPPGNAAAKVAYCPRRIILDALLVNAATEAGAEVREGFSVDEIVTCEGRVTGVRGHTNGKAVTESARVVIGADGRHSLVAKAVRPEQYHDKPPVQMSYYTYFSNLPTDAFEVYLRPPRAWAVMPTHDDLTLVIAGYPIAEFESNRKDIEANYFEPFELVPAFAERIRRAERQARFVGTSVPGYFRKPFGPGWALVGDAGYNKDFITGTGIMDAFRDAELCSTALNQSLSGKKTFEESMQIYQRTRDEQSLPMYEFTNQLAPLEPPPADFVQLLSAVHCNPDATRDFVQMNAGLLSPAEFFSEQNVQRILQQATSRPAVAAV